MMDYLGVSGEKEQMLPNRNSCCRVELDSPLTGFSIFLALCKHISKTTSCSKIF